MYKHPKWGEGLAPASCQYHIDLPADYTRPMRRRFIKAAQKAGCFYAQDPANPFKITLAFDSREEMVMSAVLFERKLAKAGKDFSIKK